MFSWDSWPRPIVALAPMAGYTDSPFRQIVKEICPDVICFTEFTSVDGLLHGNDATMRQVTFNPKLERPVVAQIFGRKPENFFKACRILRGLGVDAIDINMGCPAKKIMSSDHGSALLKNQCLSQEIVVAAVRGAGVVPVSVKMRIGTQCYNPDYFFSFARGMARSGARALTIHGRTSKQMYSGTADWNPIYELKKIVKIPVIGNGDVKNGTDAVNKLKNLDGVMAGRASFGNPWALKEIFAALHETSYSPPSITERLCVIRRHIELACTFKGEEYGMQEMRKHLAWYIRGMPGASHTRGLLVRVSAAEEAINILESFFNAANSAQRPLSPTLPQALPA